MDREAGKDVLERATASPRPSMARRCSTTSRSSCARGDKIAFIVGQRACNDHAVPDPHGRGAKPDPRAASSGASPPRRAYFPKDNNGVSSTAATDRICSQWLAQYSQSDITESLCCAVSSAGCSSLATMSTSRCSVLSGGEKVRLHARAHDAVRLQRTGTLTSRPTTSTLSPSLR